MPLALSDSGKDIQTNGKKAKVITGLRTESPVVIGQLIKNTNSNDINSVVASRNADTLEVVSNVKCIRCEKGIVMCTEVRSMIPC